MSKFFLDLTLVFSQEAALFLILLLLINIGFMNLHQEYFSTYALFQLKEETNLTSGGKMGGESIKFL